MSENVAVRVGKQGIDQAREILYGMFSPDVEPARRAFELHGEEIHPTVEALLNAVSVFAEFGSGAGRRDIEARYDRLRNKVLHFMQDFDVIVSPVAPREVFPTNAMLNAANWNLASYAAVHNITGFPSVTVRAGTTANGLPIPVEVVARPWEDHIALDVAEHIERMFGGYQPPPKNHVQSMD